jgi:hypothetical protein
MTLPAWPIANTIVLQNGFSLQRMLDPIATDMEGWQHAPASSAWR